jgi:hypothetical protein
MRPEREKSASQRSDCKVKATHLFQHKCSLQPVVPVVATLVELAYETMCVCVCVCQNQRNIIQTKGMPRISPIFSSPLLIVLRVYSSDECGRHRRHRRTDHREHSDAQTQRSPFVCHVVAKAAVSHRCRAHRTDVERDALGRRGACSRLNRAEFDCRCEARPQTQRRRPRRRELVSADSSAAGQRRSLAVLRHGARLVAIHSRSFAPLSPRHHRAAFDVVARVVSGRIARCHSLWLAREARRTQHRVSPSVVRSARQRHTLLLARSQERCRQRLHCARRARCRVSLHAVA